MKIYYHCLLSLFFIIATFSLTGQGFYKHFDSKDGLSDDHVTAVLKDRDGFLWIGTANGLNRYDGYNFKVYLPDFKRPATSVNNEYICDIVQDKKGFIWIGTNDGLSRYDPKTENFKLFKNTGRNNGSLPNAYIRDLYLDDKGILYVVCDNRDLTIYDEVTENFKTFPWKLALQNAIPESKNESYQAIYSLQRKSANEIYLKTKFGLWTFNSRNKTFQLIDKKGRSTSTSFEYQGNNWTIDNGRVFITNGNKTTLKPLAAAIETYHFDHRGVLWLGGESGLWMCEPTFQHFLFTEFKDQNSGIYKIINSKNGIYQFALNKGKDQLLVFKLNELVRTFKLGGKTSLLYEDNNGILWTSGGNKLFQINTNDLSIVEFKIPEENLSSEKACLFLDMAELQSGELWFANDCNGIIVYNSRENKWKTLYDKEQFPTTNVGVLLFDPLKNMVWMGSQDYGLFRYDILQNKFILYRPDEADMKHSIGAYVISALAKDSLGNIWVGTDHGGISKFNYKNSDATAITTLSMDNGLPSNQIFSLICDTHGDIWSTTSKGLVLINSINNSIRYFGKEEGLMENLLTNPLSPGRNGTINFAIKNGLQFYEPSKLKTSTQKHKLFFSNFKLFDKPYPDSISINYVKEINLSYKQNFFSFDLASDDFSNTKKNQFAYLLEGYDKQWNFLKLSHSGSYTNVPPGDYTLTIKGGKEGSWDITDIRLRIIIHPPFWATWWFRTLAGAIFLMLIILFYKIRINKIRKDEAIKTAFNKRIAQTEMTALRAQMNPHFVFNCLSSINHFILANRADDASAYLTKFSRLIRLILDNSRRETNDLKRELETINLYIEMEQMRFANRFNYELRIDPDLKIDEIQIPPMLIQPYVENAIWHGLMHQKSVGILKIEIKREGEIMLIIIEDNGIGRKEASQLKSKSANKNKSHGMEVTSERITLVNQLYNANASVNIFDLKDEDGEALGTRVIIQMHINYE